MLRKVIKIDKEKCNGCNLCVEACHEGAIALVNGKAQLMRDDYCDGLGDCLPVCPTNAITFEEREAMAYDEKAVKENQVKKESLPCGCPGSHARAINKKQGTEAVQACVTNEEQNAQSELSQWPIQIKLVPLAAPYLQKAKLLVAADCTAFAYRNFHQDFIKDHVTLIGCPKLDMVEYAEKLTTILQNNDIQSVTVVRMEVPCCGEIVNSVKQALVNSGKMIPWQVVTVSVDGERIDS